MNVGTLLLLPPLLVIRARRRQRLALERRTWLVVGFRTFDRNGVRKDVRKDVRRDVRRGFSSVRATRGLVVTKHIYTYIYIYI